MLYKLKQKIQTEKQSGIWVTLSDTPCGGKVNLFVSEISNIPFLKLTPKFKSVFLTSFMANSPKGWSIMFNFLIHSAPHIILLLP
jgi:hypothetical protein